MIKVSRILDDNSPDLFPDEVHTPRQNELEAEHSLRKQAGNSSPPSPGIFGRILNLAGIHTRRAAVIGTVIAGGMTAAADLFPENTETPPVPPQADIYVRPPATHYLLPVPKVTLSFNTGTVQNHDTADTNTGVQIMTYAPY